MMVHNRLGDGVVTLTQREVFPATVGGTARSPTSVGVLGWVPDAAYAKTTMPAIDDGTD